MKRAFILLLSVACTSSGDGDDDDTTCTVTAELISPAGGDAFGGGPFEVQLSDSDPDAAFDNAGTTYTRGGNIVGFWPDPPLAPGSTTTLTLQTCAGPQTFDVTTSDAGAATTATLTTTSFHVDIGDLDWVRPASFGTLVGLAPDVSTDLMIGAVSGSADSYTFRMAVLNDEGTQDLCSRTLDVPGIVQQDGYLTLPPTDISFPIGDVVLQLQDMRFTVAVNAEGTALADGSLSAFVEVAGMADLWAGGDVEGACDFFLGLGMSCTDCPDGGSCLVFDATGVTGPAIAGTPEGVDAACPE